MRFLVLILFIVSCSENSSQYFPLDKVKTWSYSVEIIPEVENKALYKKTHLSMGEKKISLNEKKKKLFPILREDGTTLYYEILDDGIYRVGKKFLKEKNIKTESKRMVLPIPLTLEKTWNVDSETYLILRKYPYYDYRATTNFKLNYKVASMKETVNTPSGTFKDCILIIGNGETNFIGNNEIGSIGIKIYSKEWYSKAIGLIKMERIEETDTDLFGTTKMVQLLESYQKF